MLLKGEVGQAYNAANERTYCSIAEMAQKIAKMADVQVKFEIQDGKKLEYPPTLYMDLDTSYLQKLGWNPCIWGGIEEMFIKMVSSF